MPVSAQISNVLFCKKLTDKNMLHYFPFSKTDNSKILKNTFFEISHISCQNHCAAALK
jgi:hypothetical protein